MALLSVKKRKEYFKLLGLGEYNEKSILKLQKMYFSRKMDHDGVYGFNTDVLLRHVANCHEVPNFEPEEFKCDCGGKYCTGYPTWMRLKTLKFIQRIRAYTGKPVYIESGVRCKTQNIVVGGVRNSKHLYGTAVDYRIPHITFNLSGRKQLINTIREWKDHDWSYCNGYESGGEYRYSSTMGTSIHTQTK